MEGRVVCYYNFWVFYNKKNLRNKYGQDGMSTEDWIEENWNLKDWNDKMHT